VLSLAAVPRRHQAGFTIVEVMVVVSILAVLIAIAAPGMRSFIENARIRATSESVQSGLSLARAEAVRQNRPVEFVLLPASWLVRIPGSGTFLHIGRGKEAFNGIDMTITPANADRLTFDSFGRTVANADGSASLASLDIESAEPPASGIYRPLGVQIQRTGMPRLRNPWAVSRDSRACL
jgi:type IV fimbrial biogenesis protein FimT